MKNLLLLFISILSFQIFSFAQEGWNNTAPAGTYPGLFGVYALDTDNVWVVGENGTLIKTTDGGINWINVPNNFTRNIKCIEFINSDTGWIAGAISGSGDDDLIFRTTDSGNSWELQPLSSGVVVRLFDIEFIKDTPNEPVHGFLAGGLASVFRSNDYGITWEDLSGNCGEGNFWACSFADKNTGWFVGYQSTSNPATIMRTTDGGMTFEAQINPTTNPVQPLRSVCFSNNQNGIAVGLVGTILFTSDGGTNWEARPNSGYRWNSVFLSETGKAWAVGNSGRIAFSTDWGYTWDAQHSDVTCELWEVYFINENEGWIVGGGGGLPGVILHTTNGGVITDVDDEISTVREFVLDQNYPNPFNPSTKIQYSIPQPNNVVIKIFNVLGKEVETLVNEEKPGGAYEITWNTENFPSGVYFYQLTAGKFIETKKMILMK